MTIIEAVLIIVGVLNIIFMAFMMSLIKDVVSIKLLITQLHSATTTLAARSINQESTLNKLGHGFVEFVNLATTMIDKVDFLISSGGMMGGSSKLYRTMDGRFTGSSLNDLMDKIKNSGKEEDYISQDDMDKLRNMFEQPPEDEDEDGYDTQR